MPIPLETILAAKAGCNQAFETILASMERIITLKASDYSSKRSNLFDSGDLAQVARLALWQCIQELDTEKGSLTTKFYPRLCGAMIDEIRRISGYRGSCKFQHRNVRMLSNHLPDNFQGIRAIEDRDELLHLLRDLSDRERECILLFGAGNTREDVSRICGIHHKTVANTIERACSKLGVSREEIRNRVGPVCKPRATTKTKTCETCGQEFPRRKGTSSTTFAAARFCSRTCVRYKN
jgi:RNA polymerase sigma factor (sigma-70 family)